MSTILDGFYTLSEEEKYYRTLYEEGRSSVEYVMLPSQVQDSARLDERIILSSAYYDLGEEETVVLMKHPCFMPRYMHSHRFVEFSYVLSGSAREEVEGSSFTVSAGDVVILMPGFYHSIWVGDEKTVVLNLLVDRDFFMHLDERFRLHLADKSHVVMDHVDLGRELETLVVQDTVRDEVRLMMKEVVFELMLLETRRQGSLVRQGEVGGRKEVFRIMSYIEEHSHDVTLTSFASHFGITEQYASRLIRDKTGLSFSDIVRRLRMEEAAQLLRHDRLSAKQIAYMVGYSSPEHFSRTFKAYYGVSPDAWRRAGSSVQVEHLL